MPGNAHGERGEEGDVTLKDERGARSRPFTKSKRGKFFSATISTQRELSSSHRGLDRGGRGVDLDRRDDDRERKPKKWSNRGYAGVGRLE